MKTGFSLCTFSHREKPVFITWEPCNENRFFPVWEKYTGKSPFWPFTGPVRDCSVMTIHIFAHIALFSIINTFAKSSLTCHSIALNAIYVALVQSVSLAVVT
jgi:hypothetical protein